MAYLEDGSDAMVALELLVDKVGVRNVLWALERICAGKAVHVAEAWQDSRTAKVWDRCATMMHKTAKGITVDPLAP